MTYEEAIEEILWVERYGFIADNSIIGTSRIKSAFQVAIEALEKRIPKKPEFTDDYYDVAVCPCCHQYEFEYGTTTWQMAFCPDCGQAIDWSDDE